MIKDDALAVMRNYIVTNVLTKLIQNDSKKYLLWCCSWSLSLCLEEAESIM